MTKRPLSARLWDNRFDRGVGTDDEVLADIAFWIDENPEAGLDLIEYLERQLHREDDDEDRCFK